MKKIKFLFIKRKYKINPMSKATATAGYPIVFFFFFSVITKSNPFISPINLYLDKFTPKFWKLY